MTWQQLKEKTERKFERKQLYSNIWGWQIQPGTKWNVGLSLKEITDLEKLFGFEFPTDYKAFLSEMNSFDHDEISIDPDEECEDEFGRTLYQYPQDYERTKWKVEELFEFINYTKEPLEKAGFDTEQIIGFIPLYGNRYLTVFSDKSLSPVISSHQGTDVILYGNSLLEYWEREFEL